MIKSRPLKCHCHRLLLLPVLAPMMWAGVAHGFEFKNENAALSGTFDTTVSYGAAWRASRPDPGSIGIGNGGTAQNIGNDDGNLNFQRGSLVASTFRVTHELELKYRNLGFFTRGTYAYDAVANRTFVNADSNARREVGQDVRLLDLYGKGTWDIGGKNFTLKVGQQVVNWGESYFIQNGMGVVNPFDVSKLHSPGSELREAYIPTPMVWASQQFGDKASVEGFYLARADHFKLDPRGTFFSTDDAISGRLGRDRIYLSAAAPDQRGGGDAIDSFLAGGRGNAWLDRSASMPTRDGGQYGVAVRYSIPELDSAELGLYHMNYHSRTPIVSFRAGAPAFFLSAAGGIVPGSASYFTQYPEDIKLWGASAAAKGPFGLSLSGEYSYRPNAPLQLSAVELTKAALSAVNQRTAGFALPNAVTGSDPATAPLPGTVIPGYQRVQMHQIQAAASKIFGPMLGASLSTLIVEAGLTRLRLPAGTFFNGPAVYNQAPGYALPGQSIQESGFATRTSWGYRLFYTVDYNDVMQGASLAARIAFSHDVKGVGPTFSEGGKALAIGASLLTRDKKWKGDIGYTSYFGGRRFTGIDRTLGGLPYASNTNALLDRDFVSASVSHSF